MIARTSFTQAAAMPKVASYPGFGSKPGITAGLAQSCTVQARWGQDKERIMANSIDRREFLKLVGVGGAVFASGLGSGVHAAGYDDFYFVQLSDAHWGFEGPPNPDAKGTLKKAVAAVNALSVQPDFVVFTGDLTRSSASSG